jgi:hypothetical protein
VSQDWRAQPLRESEYLLHSREMRRFAQADAGVSEVELDSNHARKSKASFELLQRNLAQRIGAAETN